MKPRDLLDNAATFVDQRSVLVALVIATGVWIFLEALVTLFWAGPSARAVEAHEKAVAANLAADLARAESTERDVLVRLLARLETEAAVERGTVRDAWPGQLAAFLRRSAVPGSLLLLLGWMLVLARFDNTADQLSRQLEQLVTTETEFFADVDSFFGDLLKRGVEDAQIRQLLATRLRVESDRNFSRHPNVARYYSAVVERCVRDPNFRLVRVMGSDQPAALLALCEQWFGAIGEQAPGMELRLLREPVRLTLINLAILLSEQGTEHVYIIVSPNDTEIHALRISRNRGILNAFRQYHERLAGGDWSIRLTPENYREVLKIAAGGGPAT